MVLLAGRRADVDVEAVLAGTGVTARDIETGAQSLPFEVLYRLATALPGGGSGGVGLELGDLSPVIIHGAMGVAVSASGSLGEALQTLSEMGAGPARVMRFRFEVGPTFGDLTMTPDFDLGDIRHFVLEANTVLISRVLEATVGRPIPGLEFHFPYPAPAWADLYALRLPGRIVFDADALRIRAPAAQLALPSLAVDPAARAAALRAWRREANEVEAAAHGDLAALIRSRLAEERESYPDLEAIARSVALSPRTVIRRLRDKGLRYRQLVDEARAEVACWRLAHTEDTVDQIAADLGYADPSNFSRTFRRWRGKTPTAYRHDFRESEQ
jgi:AraC-like DNA-binding protein